MLGKGTFGKVILASKNDNKQVYAVKIIKKAAVVESEQTISHTVTENRVLKHLEHPFVVRLFYAFQTDDRLFFVMEYINGGEIYTHLKRSGPFPEDKTRFYVAEIASALTYLHGKGIVYRYEERERERRGEGEKKFNFFYYYYLFILILSIHIYLYLYFISRYSETSN